DANGALTSLTDADGNTTTIERDAAGVPASITAPGGQRTALMMVAGKLAMVQNPADESVQLDYDPGTGLLSRLTDARGGLHKYAYDANGQIGRASFREAIDV